MSICGCKRATVQFITRVCYTCITIFLWPPNRAGQHILQLWFLLSSFFPSVFSAVQRVSRLAFVSAPTSKLYTTFGRLLGFYTTYSFSEALAPNGILPGAKFTLRPSLAFSYIGSVTARHSSSGRQPHIVAWYKEWNYGTFDPRHFNRGRHLYSDGDHHVGHRPTF